MEFRCVENFASGQTEIRDKQGSVAVTAHHNKYHALAVQPCQTLVAYGFNPRCLNSLDLWRWLESS
jgi:hypothetical protein